MKNLEISLLAVLLLFAISDVISAQTSEQPLRQTPDGTVVTGGTAQPSQTLISGGGSVSVSEVKLVQSNRPGSKGGWWDNRLGGWVGGILGSVLGLIGGLVGMLSAWQRTRPTAVAVTIVATSISFVVLVGGIAALILGQPYHVWYPLLLCGVLGTSVLGSGIWIIRQRSAEYELRKMSAMDAPG